MTKFAKSAEKNTIDASVMEARYGRARKLMQGIWTNKIALNTTLFPVWIGDSDCFWYERETREGQGASAIYGKQYRLVNAKAATNNIAFDHQTLATALAAASKAQVDANNLSITKVEMEISSSESSVIVVRFSAFDKRWSFDIASGACREVESLPGNEVISPNGEYVVFARDYNLWARNLKTGEEKALTADGEEFYVYGAVGGGWGWEMPGSLQVLWSPDSKQILAVQRDTRRVKSLPVVHHVPKDGAIRPYVEYPRIALPGDEHVEEFRLLAINVETGRHQPASYCPVPLTRNSWGFFEVSLGWWAVDGRRAYFVHVERDYKTVRVLEFDTHTGSVRLLFEETSDTQINLMHNGDESPTFMPLPETNEMIWFSERTGWAHLYLYDLETGRLKNTITSGNWLVRNIVDFDPKRRELFVQTAGRVAGRDPYYRDLARVQIDTGEMVTLATSDHEYVAITQTQKEMMADMALNLGKDVSSSNGISKSGNFAVLTRSRADEVPVSLLIDRDGKEVLQLETADVSALPEGWQWPEPVALKAADGITDIYGVVYRPSDFSPEKSYPIVSHVFNTPDFPWAPKGSFTNDKIFGCPYLDAAAVAELGFIVVQIDGRGASFRNKAFLDYSYGWLESASDIEDQIAGIRQLAKRHSYMDVDRIGCIGPTGGPGPVQGLLQHPDFYSVGIVQHFHDSRLMSSTMWGDKYEGLPGSGTKSRNSGRKHQFPEEYAEKLQGKLLMMIGMLDPCTPPAATFRVIEALQKANKDLDQIVLPNLGRDLPSPYLIRRSWDYLVKHLLGVEPPKEFKLTGVYGVE